MKKFFSLMLAVLLLVSALPFQAFAANEKCVYCESTNLTPLPDADSAVAATCTSPGNNVFKCNTCNKYFGIAVAALGHDYSAWNVTKQATCIEAGSQRKECNRCHSSNATLVEAIPATGHTLNAGTITTVPGCATPGVKTFSCTKCNYTTTEAVPATNNHDFDANGVCRNCNGSDGQVRTNVTFVIENVAGVNKFYYETYIDTDPFTVPTAELIANYEFKGWWTGRGGSGTQLTSGASWDKAGKADTYYAWYVYNPNRDGVSTVTVTARCYIDNIGSSYQDIPVLTQALPDNTNVFDWLQNNKNTTILDSVYSKVDLNKYEWKNRYFYNHNGNEVLTEQTVFANGPKAILIKLEAKDNTTRANVQLYLHTSTTAANPFRILDMNGYTSGMNVTRDAAANLIKQYYSYKNIGNLFTESDWNALQNGESVAGRTSVYIADNGTYKIHVVVNNASSKSSSKADPNNPKTGDYITIAVGTMVMAAAAFITLAEMKKRKMI